ncbi:DUF3726 domain-containing protein [Pelagibius sp. Alg239-R121]|uniref:DUF3726 domain-containing protein n=1 Tax=Pelagibius sp. Alg239-R121 TaxID=2993448 RepID=UPI0024A6CEAE|nr:DUF3726 domain-containing protein [Pelagibius sp. Alg239-R121]
MSWSLGETRSLAIKAARGAGMTWGLAEDAGFAVQWLQANGSPGVQILAEYLSWRDDAENEITPAWFAFHQPESPAIYCPIELGTAILDSGKTAPNRFDRVAHPLLLAPFLGVATASGVRCLSWHSTEILLCRNGFTTSAQQRTLLVEQAACQIADSKLSRLSNRIFQRVPDSEQRHIARLEKFAARTYAPASEQSRLTGAGAGVNDND